MSDEPLDNPCAEDGTDEFANPTEYDENVARKEGEAIQSDLAESGILSPNPAGGAADIPEDRVSRAEAVMDGESPANAVPPGEAGRFGASVSSARNLKGDRVSLDQSELAGLMDRITLLESAEQPIGAPTPPKVAPVSDMPLRFVLMNHYGGKYASRSFRTLEVLKGYAQTQPGESRIFAYEKWPPEGDSIEMMEITALGQRVARGG